MKIQAKYVRNIQGAGVVALEFDSLLISGKSSVSKTYNTIKSGGTKLNMCAIFKPDGDYIIALLTHGAGKCHLNTHTHTDAPLPGSINTHSL